MKLPKNIRVMYGGRDRVGIRSTTTVGRREYAQNLILAFIWPFLAAVIHVKRYRRAGILSGFVVFCTWAGWTYIPSEGSDAHTYAARLATDSEAWSSAGEPFTRMLFWLVAHLGVGYQWYFALVGLVYGLTVSWVVRLFFKKHFYEAPLALVTFVFIAVFFLNWPVFSAINARYHLGIWVMLVATLLVLEGRWRPASCVAFFGVMVHFGHAIFALALLIWFASRYLNRWQIFFAYSLLLIAFFLPANAFLEWAAETNPFTAGAFGEKLIFYSELAERNLGRASSGAAHQARAWFLVWYQQPIFWSLLVSGHILFLRIAKGRNRTLHQLWLLIIVMLALQIAVGAEGHTAGRVQRNTTALLLLWHAQWFLLRRDGARVALLLNVLPLAFYFIVSYRRWLNDANLAAFLPAPYGIYPEFWPSVMRALGFG